MDNPEQDLVERVVARGISRGRELRRRRTHRHVAVVGGTLVASVSLALGLIISNGAPGSGSPKPLTPLPARLGAVQAFSCTSEKWCALATGTWPNTSQFDLWNGRRLEVMPTTDGLHNVVIFGMSCASTSACAAVGTTDQRAAAFEWDGSSWTTSWVKLAAHHAFEFSGVSCASASYCLAVGEWLGNGPIGTVVAQWNGLSWRLNDVTSPAVVDPNLQAVSCPIPSRCIAVGTGYPNGRPHGPIAESFNGSRWMLLPNPPPGSSATRASKFYPGGISCTSVNSCVAVGSNLPNAPLIDHWNGRNWTPMTVPKFPKSEQAELGPIACSTASNGELCLAVGILQPSVGAGGTCAGDLCRPANGNGMALWWNGSRWAHVAVPPQGKYVSADLSDVACFSGPRARCLALDSRQTNGKPGASYDLYSWNGSSWARFPTLP